MDIEIYKPETTAIGKLESKLVQSGDLDFIQLPSESKLITTSAIQLNGSNGQKYFVVATPQYKINTEMNVKVIDVNGQILENIFEPEMNQGTPKTYLAKDDSSLYIGTIGQEGRSFIAKYDLKNNFELVWKTYPQSCGEIGGNIYSISTTESSVLAFNMTTGYIEEYDKSDGYLIGTINLRSKFSRSSHRLATYNSSIIAAAPGLHIDGLINIPNRLKIFNEDGELVQEMKLSTSPGILNDISVDQEKRRVYLAMDNYVITFDSNGNMGGFIPPDGVTKIRSIDIDQSTGDLVITQDKVEENGLLTRMSYNAINQFLDAYTPNNQRYLP